MNTHQFLILTLFAEIYAVCSLYLVIGMEAFQEASKYIFNAKVRDFKFCCMLKISVQFWNADNIAEIVLAFCKISV